MTIKSRALCVELQAHECLTECKLTPQKENPLVPLNPYDRCLRPPRGQQEPWGCLPLHPETQPWSNASTVTRLLTQTFNNRPAAGRGRGGGGVGAALPPSHKYSIWGWLCHLGGWTGRINTGMFPRFCKAGAGIEFLRWRGLDFEPDSHTKGGRLNGYAHMHM